MAIDLEAQSPRLCAFLHGGVCSAKKAVDLSRVGVQKDGGDFEALDERVIEDTERALQAGWGGGRVAQRGWQPGRTWEGEWM